MISVIVPVYKVEAFLPECVDSILNQTFRDFELILVDDGSPDGCPALCDGFALRDSRVRVIHKRNGGVSSARNAGLQAARGKYVTFIDSDDSVDAGFFEYAVGQLENARADMVLTGLVMETWLDGAITERVEYRIGQTALFTVRELLENLTVAYPLICICGPWCKLYLREKIEKIGLRFDETMTMGEDTWFNLHYYEACEALLFSERVFYHYRRGNADSLFSKFYKDTCEIYEKVYGKIREMMVSLGCGPEARQRFEALYGSVLFGCIPAYFRHREQVSLGERRQVLERIGRNPAMQALDIHAYGSRQGLVLRLLKQKKTTAALCLLSLRYGLFPLKAREGAKKTV